MSKCRYQRAFGNFEVLIRERKTHAPTSNPITLGPLVVIQNVSSFTAARTR